MKRFLAFSLVLFFFRTALIAQPSSGPYPSGPTAAQIAAAGGVTTNNYLDVMQFGAKGDGVTDDTPAFTNALKAGALLGVSVRVPAGKIFKLNPFTMTNNQALIGSVGSHLLFSGAFGSPAISMSYLSTNIMLASLEIDGGDNGTIPTSDDGRTGVLVWNVEQPNWVVQNLYVHGFGKGLDFYGVNGNTSSLIKVNDCTLRYNWRGIFLEAQAEYIGFKGITCNFNHIGIENFGGNNDFSSCDFSRNDIGMNIYGNTVSNGGHGFFNACNFNHANSFSIVSTNLNLGESFIGCSFIPPNIYFTNAQNLNFIGCLMGWNSSNGVVTFDHCTNYSIISPQNPYGLTNSYVIINTNSQPTIIEDNIGNISIAGTFAGNGSGLTNLNAISPNLIPSGINGFEVVVTNTTGPHGLTNFYGSGIVTNRVPW